MKINDETEHEDTNNWLTTYSDMVTLLFTFFVLMFAISNVDAMKFAILAKAMSSTGITADELIQIQLEHGMDLEGGGMYDIESPIFMFPNDSDIDDDIDDTDNIDNTDETAPDEGEEREEDEEETEETERVDGARAHLSELHGLIANYIAENNLNSSIYLYERTGGEGSDLLLSLTSDVWFDSGSSEVSEEMYAVAAKLGQLLKDTHSEEQPFDIIVSGHTDNVPMKTERHPDNWELSLDRAGRFMRIIIEESGISSQCFSARGYGEEAPIDTNDTPAGRQRNRRVEVLISHGKKQGEMILSGNTDAAADETSDKYAE